MKINVFAPSKLIIRQKRVKPNFCMDVENFSIFLNLINDYQNECLVVKLNTSLQKVSMIDSAIIHNKQKIGLR